MSGQPSLRRAVATLAAYAIGLEVRNRLIEAGVIIGMNVALQTTLVLMRLGAAAHFDLDIDRPLIKQDLVGFRMAILGHPMGELAAGETVGEIRVMASGCRTRGGAHEPGCG